MNFKIMAVHKDGSSELFRRKKFNPDTDSLMILADNEHEFYFENIEKADNLDDRLEKAMEVIDLLIWVDEESQLDVDEYICMCDSEHCIYEMDYIDECNFYKHDSLSEWAEDLIHDLGFIPNNIPSFITNHIDWNGIAQEILVDYNYCQLEDGSYLIWEKR